MATNGPITRLIEACEAYSEQVREAGCIWSFERPHDWEGEWGRENVDTEPARLYREAVGKVGEAKSTMVDAMDAAAPAIKTAGYDPTVVYSFAEVPFFRVDEVSEKWHQVRPMLRACLTVAEPGTEIPGPVDGTSMTANERMIAAVDDDPRRIELTQKQWADLLKCSYHYVRDLPMWIEVRRMKKEEKRRRAKQVGEL